MLEQQCSSELTPRSMRLRSSYLNENHPLFGIAEKLELKPFGSPTLSDMALLKMPSVKIGPGDSARSHSANEYILVQEIKDAIGVYGQLINELVKIEL